MVSNARLDLPDPESPVTTMSRSRGISSEMFFRLCTRALCTAIVVRATVGAAFLPFAAALAAIRRLAQGEEGQLLHVGVALLRQSDARRRLADEPLVGQVLARDDHALHVEVPPEVALDLGARPRF